MDLGDEELCGWEHDEGYTDSTWPASSTQPTPVPAQSIRSSTKTVTKPPTLQPIGKRSQKLPRLREDVLKSSLPALEPSLSTSKSLPVLASEYSTAASIHSHFPKQPPLSMVVIESKPFLWSCARVLRLAPQPVPSARRARPLQRSNPRAKPSKLCHKHEPRELANLPCRLITSIPSDLDATSFDVNSPKIDEDPPHGHHRVEETIGIRFDLLDQCLFSPAKEWIYEDQSYAQLPLRARSLHHQQYCIDPQKYIKQTVESHLRTEAAFHPTRQTNAVEAHQSPTVSAFAIRYGLPAPRRQLDSRPTRAKDSADSG